MAKFVLLAESGTLVIALDVLRDELPTRVTIDSSDDPQALREIAYELVRADATQATYHGGIVDLSKRISHLAPQAYRRCLESILPRLKTLPPGFPAIFAVEAWLAHVDTTPAHGLRAAALAKNAVRADPLCGAGNPTSLRRKEPIRTFDVRPFFYACWRDGKAQISIGGTRCCDKRGLGLWIALRTRRKYIPFSERSGARTPWRIGPFDVFPLHYAPQS